MKPQVANDSRTAGPALLATMPGKTNMPAPIIVSTPTDMAVMKPKSRTRCVRVLALEFLAFTFSLLLENVVFLTFWVDSS